jgi:hypothetical protein
VSTGPLTATVAGLAAALAPVGKVHAALPERFTPPCVLLKPADPMVTTEGHPAGIGDLHYDVVLMPRRGTNPTWEAAAFAMAEEALAALRAHPHAVAESVSAPYDLQVGQNVHLAIRINVKTPTRLTTD